MLNSRKKKSIIYCFSALGVRKLVSLAMDFFIYGRNCSQILKADLPTWGLRLDPVAESICTHYSNLSGRPDIFLGSGNFKKSGTLLFAKSKVQKNRVTVFQKEKRPGCLISFWITMTLVFLHPVFFKKQGSWFFFRVTNWPWFSKQE